MNHAVKSLLGLSLVLGLASAADARSIGPNGFIGPVTAACWTRNFGTVTNCGSDNQALTWELPVDSAGDKPVSVAINIPSSGGVAICEAISYDQFGNQAGGGLASLITTVGNSTTKSLNANVPGGGTLIAWCMVSAGVSVGAINWTP
jgi:hypothetical protein